MVLSIDGGYGHFKYAINGSVGKIPSNIERLGITMNGFENDGNIITFNGEKYLIGENATNPIITRNFEFLEKYTPLFIYHIVKQLCIKFDEITELKVGLSLVNLSNSINKEKFISLFSKEYVIDGSIIKFQNVKFNIQGVGIFNMFKKTHKDANETNVFVIDVGYNTLDALSFINGKPNPKQSFANEKGVNLIINQLKILIGNQFGVSNTPEQKANEILQTKVFKFRGVNYDLSKEIKEIVKNYIEDIVYELKTRAKDSFDYSDYIVFAGGGAYLLKDYITPQANYVFLDKPEYGNVLGY
jgi:plasmid segregation protein ParM